MDLLILLKAFILGVVEGATEFLPVSSTGHLIVIGDLLNFNDDKGKVFEIVIQLGAILAICWEYRIRLKNVALGLSSSLQSQKFVLNVFIGFLPAAVLGLMFHHQIKTYLFSPINVAIALIVGGFIILLVERKYASATQAEAVSPTVDAITPIQALKIGFAQSIAMIPGVSRSGATILGGMIFGLSRQAATEFSFFLAIPVMFAASAYDLYKNWALFDIHDLPIFAVGFITAFLAALIAVKTLVRYVANHDFRIFAYYRIIFGSLVLIYLWKFA
ncbi:MAG: undecaprenyl-diphosphate phosphatase [Methylophilaceae bacterium]